MKPQAFFIMHTDFNRLLENESKEDLSVPHDLCVQSFMSVPADDTCLDSYLNGFESWLHTSDDLKESSPGTHGVL